MFHQLMGGIGADGGGGALLNIPRISPIQSRILSLFSLIHVTVCTAPSFTCCMVVGTTGSKSGNAGISFAMKSYRRSAFSISPLLTRRHCIFKLALLVGLMARIISFLIVCLEKNIVVTSVRCYNNISPTRFVHPLQPQLVAGQPQFCLATNVTSCGQRAY